MPNADQERLIEQMWHADKPVGVISKFAKMSDADVRRYIHEHKESCPPRRQTVFSGTESQFIIIAWNNGATIDQISDALNITRTSVTNYICRHRDTCPNKRDVVKALSKRRKIKAQMERAERHKNDGPRKTKPYKISDEKVEEIIDCHKRGLSRGKIARKCGVGVSTVSRYIKEWRLEQAAI